MENDGILYFGRNSPKTAVEEIDFKIRQVVVISKTEMGPGSHGNQVVYFKYGFGAVCEPEVSIMNSEGKIAVVIVPLPDSGMIKMSDLKKRANKLWVESRDSLNEQHNSPSATE